MIILLGASASGKTEVAKLLVKKYSYKKVITYTTRPIRSKEVDGIDYHFKSVNEFKKLLDQDFFFEYVNYNGNFYGTAKEDINDKSVLIVEPNGFKSYANSSLKNIVSFHLSSDEEHRIQRMIERGDETEKINSRIVNDRISFKDENIEGVDFTLNSNDLTIEELADEIEAIYKEKIGK
ncbi:MAG: AAA family ATPase [Gammaproteobacteria bacterium]|nr:AAA family ATPase [Gammaproteobacteria bacterium]